MQAMRKGKSGWKSAWKPSWAYLILLILSGEAIFILLLPFVLLRVFLVNIIVWIRR